MSQLKQIDHMNPVQAEVIEAIRRGDVLMWDDSKQTVSDFPKDFLRDPRLKSYNKSVWAILRRLKAKMFPR